MYGRGTFWVVMMSTSLVAGQVYKGFNYGNTYSDGTLKTYWDYVGEFNAARNMQWTANTFTSARLFTSRQGDTGYPIEAFKAAMDTNTSLLLGLWSSAGQAQFSLEIDAISIAIAQWGTAFTEVVVGISVGSEDIYRTTPLGIASNAGPGATPEQIIEYVQQLRDALVNTSAADKPIGHVDTYDTYVNAGNAALIPALDFLGVDAYPYYESSKQNDIDNAANLFFDDLSQVQAVAQGKAIWVTETGWPISGPQFGAAIANPENAGTYYREVGCRLFSTGWNTWWFTLQDQQPVSPAGGVVFGVAGPGNPPPTDQPAYSLAC